MVAGAPPLGYWCLECGDGGGCTRLALGGTSSISRLLHTVQPPLHSALQQPGTRIALPLQK